MEFLKSLGAGLIVLFSFIIMVMGDQIATTVGR